MWQALAVMELICREHSGIDKRRTCMVGDTLYTDNHPLRQQLRRGVDSAGALGGHRLGLAAAEGDQVPGIVLTSVARTC